LVSAVESIMHAAGSKRETVDMITRSTMVLSENLFAFERAVKHSKSHGAL